MSQNKLSPGMQQYVDMKKDYPDAFLFFRMGDFYELFYEDATRAAQILEISIEIPLPHAIKMRRILFLWQAFPTIQPSSTLIP